VAVEASPGHDIGRVSMTGNLIREQLKRLKILPSAEDMKKVYRKAKPVDIIKWEEARKLETPTMLRSRQIAEDLKLNMKIGDVEYQGDKTKAYSTISPMKGSISGN
jgi:cell fate regulator YaaT (PSP1 superfamily)